MYKNKFQYRYYALPLLVLSIFYVVKSLHDYLDGQSRFALVLVYLFLSIFILFVFVARFLNMDYYQISKEKIVIFTVLVKREFPFSRFSSFRISKRSFLTNRGIFAKDSLTKKEVFIIPQFGTPDRLEKLLEIFEQYLR